MNNNKTTVAVKDKEYVITRIINNIEIGVLSITLGKCLDVSASVKENNGVIKTHYFHIEGADYENWGNDDKYIEDLVLFKLGFERRD